MSTATTQYQQPIGSPMTEWITRPWPQRTTIEGGRCRLEPLDANQHAAALFAAYSQAPDGRDWTYMSSEPFTDAASYFSHVEKASSKTDPIHYAVIDLMTGRAVDTLVLMRIDPANGVAMNGSATA